LGGGKGATASLLHDGEEVGKVLRTRKDVSPVFVSVGHRIDLPAALQVVLDASPCYRIPEPIRRAHRLSNQLRRGAAG
jgi:deoxyribonuclease V